MVYIIEGMLPLVARLRLAIDGGFVFCQEGDLACGGSETGD